MTDTWITADTHFGHKGIVKWLRTQFSDVDEMDEALIKFWNDRVGLKDTVWHLGDIALCNTQRTGEILDALNGRIHLIEGNHDKSIVKKYASRFESVRQLHVYKQDKMRAVMCHYPLTVWDRAHHGVPHFHGHSHGSLRVSRPRRLDVGIDVTGLTPALMSEAFEMAMAEEYEGVDHHALA